MFRQSRLRIGAGILALAVAVTLTGCGTGSEHAASAKPTAITIGSQGTLENEVLAQVYGQALEAKGYAVSYNAGVGDRAAFVAGLQSGIVDLVPDYSSSLIAHFDPRSGLTTIEAIEIAMPAFLKPLKLRVLDAAPAQTSAAFVVRKEFAREHNLVNIGDLADISASITIGGEPDFPDRSYGTGGLSRIYAVNDWNFTAFPEIDDSDKALIDALVSDEVQVAVVHSTAPGILDEGLVTLGDPQSMIAAQNIIPVVSKASYTKRFGSIINGVSLNLTTADLRQFNKLIRVEDHSSAEVIAHDWLEKHGYLD